MGSGGMALATTMALLHAARHPTPRPPPTPEQLAAQAALRERDAWNKQIEANKAAKRRAKGKP